MKRLNMHRLSADLMDNGVDIRSAERLAKLALAGLTNDDLRLGDDDKLLLKQFSYALYVAESNIAVICESAAREQRDANALVEILRGYGIAAMVDNNGFFVKGAQ